MLYLAEKFGAFVPASCAARAECLSWLFRRWGSAPFLGGGFGHFYTYAPTKDLVAAINRYAMEAKRQMDVFNQRLATHEFLGDAHTVADMAAWPWYGALALGQPLRRSGVFAGA